MYGILYLTGKVIPLYDPKLSHFHCWSITASFPGYHQPFALRRSPTTQRPIAKPAAWSRMLHRCTQLKNISRMTLDCPLTLEHPAIPKLSNWSHKKEAQKWPTTAKYKAKKGLVFDWYVLAVQSWHPLGFSWMSTVLIFFKFKWWFSMVMNPIVESKTWPSTKSQSPVPKVRRWNYTKIMKPPPSWRKKSRVYTTYSCKWNLHRAGFHGHVLNVGYFNGVLATCLSPESGHV